MASTVVFLTTVNISPQPFMTTLSLNVRLTSAGKETTWENKKIQL